ncbi:MAG: hypothetical protein JW760_02155 [Spirochaetales bacterium]|nr:hypothetical protein [Spirochaetales bacterium]
MIPRGHPSPFSLGVLFLFCSAFLFPVYEGNIAVFSPHPGLQDPGDEILQEAASRCLELFAFYPFGKTVLLDFQIKPEQMDSLLDVLRGMDPEGSLELPEQLPDLLKEAFLVIIPEITDFSESAEAENLYRCELEMLFNMVDPKGRYAFEALTVRGKGEGETRDQALQHALEDLVAAAEGKIKRLPVFTASFQVVEILDSRRIVLAGGKGDAVEPGDEYRIVSPLDKETLLGMVVIEQTAPEVSYGYILFSQEPVNQYTYMEKVPRLGVDLSVYGKSMIWVDTSIDNPGIPVSGVFGLRGFPARGFPRIRPFVGLEVPVHANLSYWPGFPVNISAGIEAQWNIGRFQIVPGSSIGIGVLLPDPVGTDILLSHVGGVFETAFTWLFHPSFRVFFSLGYAGWFRITSSSLSPQGVDDYGGILLGIGLRIRL